MNNPEDIAVEEKLLATGPDLLDKLQLTERLLRCLERSKVLSKMDKASITAMKYNDQEKIGQLLDHVRRDPLRRYNALVEALRETGQFGVLEILHEPRYAPGQEPNDDEEEDLNMSIGEDGEILAEKLKDNIANNKAKLRGMDLEGLLLYWTDYNILTDDQVEAVMGRKTKAEKIHELFTVRLVSRPPCCYLRFGKALIDSKQGHFLDDLNCTEGDKEFLKHFNTHDH